MPTAARALVWVTLGSMSIGCLRYDKPAVLPDLPPNAADTLPPERRAYVHFESGGGGKLAYLRDVKVTHVVDQYGTNRYSFEEAVLQGVCDLPCNRWIEARRYLVVGNDQFPTRGFDVPASPSPLKLRVDVAKHEPVFVTAIMASVGALGLLLGGGLMASAATRDLTDTYTEEMRTNAWVAGGALTAVGVAGAIATFLWWPRTTSDVYSERGRKLAFTPFGGSF